MDNIHQDERKPYRKPEIDEKTIELGVYGDYDDDLGPPTFHD